MVRRSGGFLFKPPADALKKSGAENPVGFPLKDHQFRKTLPGGGPPSGQHGLPGGQRQDPASGAVLDPLPGVAAVTGRVKISKTPKEIRHFLQIPDR